MSEYVTIPEVERYVKGRRLKGKTTNTLIDNMNLFITSASYQFKGFFWHTIFDSIDNFDQSDIVGNGSVSYSALGGRLGIRSGNTTGDYTRFQRCIRDDLAFANLTWSKKRRFKTVVQLVSNTNQVIYVALGDVLDMDWNEPHVGFRIVDNEIFGSVGAGPAVGAEWTGVLKTFNALDIVALEAILTPNVGVDFYIDGVKEGSLGKTYLPFDDDVTERIILQIAPTSKEDAYKTVYLAEWFFLQEP